MTVAARHRARRRLTSPALVIPPRYRVRPTGCGRASGRPTARPFSRTQIGPGH
jgi:hypothetical protein